MLARGSLRHQARSRSRPNAVSPAAAGRGLTAGTRPAGLTGSGGPATTCAVAHPAAARTAAAAASADGFLITVRRGRGARRLHPGGKIAPGKEARMTMTEQDQAESFTRAVRAMRPGHARADGEPGRQPFGTKNQGPMPVRPGSRLT